MGVGLFKLGGAFLQVDPGTKPDPGQQPLLPSLDGRPPDADRRRFYMSLIHVDSLCRVRESRLEASNNIQREEKARADEGSHRKLPTGRRPGVAQMSLILVDSGWSMALSCQNMKGHPRGPPHSTTCWEVAPRGLSGYQSPAQLICCQCVPLSSCLFSLTAVHAGSPIAGDSLIL